jgi:alpha-beta hydrolase superfamily lysophospholipase
MSAEPNFEAESSPAGGLPEALYFDSGKHRLFGWLHRPVANEAATIGLVVCKPFGYEAICAHRSVRAFAEAAANLGMPALRFDYAGTGDSAELDPEADQLEVWVEDVIAAVDALRRLASVERVYVLGFRLGALLATLAAIRCQDVSGLMLVAPIISGRRYVRELRMTRLAATIGAEPEESSGRTPGAGCMEVSGFFFSAATLASLAQVDLKAPRVMPAADVLVIDGDKMPVSGGWVDELGGVGARANYRALPGLVEMIMTAPHFASIPHEMVTAMCDWLAPLRDRSPSAPERPAQRFGESARAPSTALMNLHFTESGDQTLVTERPVFLTSSPVVLFGIVAEPEQKVARLGGVILINAGADYHIGASGMYVKFARRWARRGYVVLRVDLAGLGDSATRRGQPDNVVFPAAALDDIRAAIEWMRTRCGVTEITLCGLCSGAYHALRAAATALPLERVVMVNPETFFWNESMSIYDMQISDIVKGPAIDRGKLFSAGTWKRLLLGQIDVRYVLRRYVRRVLIGVESTCRDAARRLRIPLPHDLGRQLEEIATRGVRMVFVFSRGEPGIELLQMQAGRSLKRLGECCRIHVIDGADHVFSKFDSRMALQDLLGDELFEPMEIRARGGS